MVLPLLAVGDDRRACGFKSFDRVANRVFIETIEAGVLTIDFCESPDETERSRNTADGLGGYGHR